MPSMSSKLAESRRCPEGQYERNESNELKGKLAFRRLNTERREFHEHGRKDQ